MKINFKAPKYIIPLIILPFIFLINFLILDFFPEKELDISKLENKQDLNTSLPDPNMGDIGIDTKMDNLKNSYKSQTDFSAISEEIKEGSINEQIEESLYSKTEAEKLIQLQDSLKALKKSKDYKKTFKTGKNYTNNRKNEYNNFKQQKAQLKEQNILTPDEQFAKEMKMIDSILNPDKYKKKVVKKPVRQQVKETKIAHTVINKENVKSQHFNTVSSNTKVENVEGMLDERIKVYQGSRVRIKLASTILIDDIEIPKNQYVYGIVKAFKPQRIEIAVTNILVNNVIYDVDLDVYDLDGMKGLYVPSSKFREFTKELGSESVNASGSNINIEQQEQQSFVLDLVDKIGKTTSKAVSSLIRKNKATLKYNTKIYLINNNKK